VADDAAGRGRGRDGDAVANFPGATVHGSAGRSGLSAVRWRIPWAEEVDVSVIPRGILVFVCRLGNQSINQFTYAAGLQDEGTKSI
jgi:hypothetical protein